MALFLIKNLFQDLNSQFEICLICVLGPTAQYRILRWLNLEKNDNILDTRKLES